MGTHVVKTESEQTQVTGVTSKQHAETEFKLAMDAFIDRLHKALDFHRLITCFVAEVRRVLPCDGIEYEEESLDLYFIDGSLSRQTCHYNLKYENESLGTIKFSRSKLFSEDELTLIEGMLSGLTLPLRNALQYQRAIKIAQRDNLTGLRNGAYYHDSVDIEIERAHRYNMPFSLIMIDLDNFKCINEAYGRETGDEALKHVARLIQQQARSSDIVFRHAGDAFLVFLPNTANSEATLVAERIKDAILLQPLSFDSQRAELTLSAGVVTVSSEDTTYRMIDRADKALFHAKILGKNQVHSEALPEQRTRGWP